MADGHLNKCKSCCKEQAKERHHTLNTENEEWRKAELKRHRAKAEKARKEGKSTKTSSESQKKYYENNKEKKYSHTLVARAIKKGILIREPCFCGDPNSEGHHEDYSKPLEVIWLCPKHHGERHVELRGN